jgi:hypothetical protein
VLAILPLCAAAVRADAVTGRSDLLVWAKQVEVQLDLHQGYGTDALCRATNSPFREVRDYMEGRAILGKTLGAALPLLEYQALLPAV